ncbi:MAG: hypothetical protein ACOCP4_01685, partial [Candidatus Woesearchaeota archaeon]
KKKKKPLKILKMKEKLKNKINYYTLISKLYLNKDGKTRRAIDTFIKKVISSQVKIYRNNNVSDYYILYRLRNKYYFKASLGEKADFCWIKFIVIAPFTLLYSIFIMIFPDLIDKTISIIIFFLLFYLTFKNFFIGKLFPSSKSELYYYAYKKLDDLLLDDKKREEYFKVIYNQTDIFPEKKDINLKPSELHVLIATAFNSLILNKEKDKYNIKQISQFITDNFKINGEEIKSLDKKINDRLNNERGIDKPLKSLLFKMLNTAENPQKIINHLQKDFQENNSK